MSRKDEKGKRFEFLVSRTDEALEEGYYIEAIALTYALMEERTYGLLNRLGIRYGSRDKIAKCISCLRDSIVQKNISVVVGKMGTCSIYAAGSQLFCTFCTGGQALATVPQGQTRGLCCAGFLIQTCIVRFPCRLKGFHPQSRFHKVRRLVEHAQKEFSRGSCVHCCQGLHH